jgi:internalin A
MDKPNEILRLEKLFNIELRLLSENDEITSITNSNTYKRNKKNKVVGINLNSNQITKINLYDFEYLTHLILAKNKLTEITGISNLKHLSHIDVSNNQIMEMSWLVNTKNLKHLDLGNNKISDITHLENNLKLKHLYLQGNEINEIKGLDKLSQLFHLTLSNNKINKLKNLDNLINLIEFEVFGNNISKIEGLENLKNLKSLDLSDNSIRLIEGLETLTNLVGLDLSENEISEISGTDNLKNLQYLNISYNKITKIYGLDNLEYLKNLDLSNNNIKKIEGLDNLRNIYDINLSDNNITEIINLDNLSTLREIDLSNNYIDEIKNLDYNYSLYSLILFQNNISQIKGLENLNNLQFLDLSFNHLKNLSGLENLINLNALYLESNEIDDIAEFNKFIKSLTLLNELYVYDNPFVKANNIIVDINSNSYDIIINELHKLESDITIIKLPLKICLLGNHASGKSTFLQYFLKNKIVDTDSTHVLNIIPYKKNRLNKIPDAIFFDFGGQDYYHGIYKAFLSNASSCLLFWNPDTDTNSSKKDSKGSKNINFDRKYWLGQLNYVSNLNKNTDDEISVCQIQTHADLFPQKNLESSITSKFFYLTFDRESLQKKANKLILDGFKEYVIEHIFERKQHEVSKDELKLYQFITKNNNKFNKLNVSDLLVHYNKSQAELNLLQAELDQLSKKGLILYYKESELLKQIVWINPEKIVEEIHEIFNEEILKTFNGEVPKETFENSVKDIDILELLKFNKVIFLDENSEIPKYIIPGYLKSTTDSNDDYFIFSNFNQYNFILKFQDFIPFGLINQLICKYGGNPEKKIYRKDQLVFTTKTQKAKVLIKLDYNKLTISTSIFLIDNRLNIKEIEKEIFFDILKTYWGVEYLDLMYKISEKYTYYKKLLIEFDNFNTYEYSPNDMYISTNGIDFIHYKTLEDETKTKGEIISYKTKIENSFEPFDFTCYSTLPTINFVQFSNNKNIKTMKKVFISYSHVDINEKQRLMTFLKPLERSGKISIWQDLKLKAGEKVKKEIINKLDEADIVIMLISQDFISSDFIYDIELQNAMKKKIADKVKILPVLISDCTIFDLDLNVRRDDDDNEEKVMMGDYYFVPQDDFNNLKAVKRWDINLQDTAWKKVYDELKKLI